MWGGQLEKPPFSDSSKKAEQIISVMKDPHPDKNIFTTIYK